MTPIHLIGSTYAVEVPEGATGFGINKYGNGSELNYWLIAGAKDTLIVTDLPPGNWQIICTTKEAKVQDLVQIVEGVDSEGRGYIFKNYHNGMYVFAQPASSLRSLLASKGLNPETNYLIIKKVS